jgi:hypothetical protein
MMRLLVIHLKMEQLMLITFDLVESMLVSKSIVVLLIFQILMEKLPHGVLMDLQKDVQNTMPWDAGLLSGEEFSKLIKIVLLILQSKKLLILSLVMELYVKITDLFLSSNLKFSKMEIMILKSVLRFLKKFSRPSCSNY